MKLLRNGLLTIGLISCGDDKSQQIQSPVQTEEKKPEAVIFRHNGRLGLEGEVICFTLIHPNEELELAIDRTIDPRKRKIVYSERNIDSDTVYRCKPANPEEKIVNNSLYENKYYDIKFWSVLGSKRSDLYPVNGFNFDIRRNGSVDFLVGSLDPGKYRLELPVFGPKRNERGTFSDVYLGTRSIDFNFDKTEIERRETAKDNAQGNDKMKNEETKDNAQGNDKEETGTPTKTTTDNSTGQELHPVGTRALEAGR